MPTPVRPRRPACRRGRVVRRGRGLVAAFLLAGLVGTVEGDLLVPKSGPKLSGVVVKRTESEVVFNPYWSDHPEMTFEVVRLPADQVKKLDVEPRSEPEFFRRLAARTPGDVAGLVALAAWAKERKLRPHGEMALAIAVAEGKGAAGAALAELGGQARFDALAKGNPVLDAELLALLRKVAIEPDVAQRRTLAASIAARGSRATPDELERIRRSATQPKGLREDVPLSVHADRYGGAVYTIFVPEAYDPATPWPLLVGLHGGGPDGKALDEVVGSGPSAMNFYRGLAEEHGVIVACPTAQVAPWGVPINESLVRDVILEVRLLFHVDPERIHLTGHSMGGYGTWSLGPRMADVFATISPMAGAGNGTIKPLVDTKTPVFVYHSADDFIPVAPDRAAAKALRESGLDFVYTELDREGHGCPESVRKQLFEFLLPRRNADPAVKDLWPRSSFAGKATSEEKQYLGDPLAELEGRPPALDDWLAAIRVGGGRARAAVDALAASKPSGAAEGAAKLVKDEKLSPWARAEAARLSGLLGDATAAPALRKVLGSAATRDASVLAVAAAKALAACRDAGASEAFVSGTKAWSAWFDGKRMGETMRFSDWERGVRTLAAIVFAWAELGGAGSVEVLDRHVVARVFGAPPKVETSERVPQDPGVARALLAGAVGRAYAAGKAPPSAWDTLFRSLVADAGAKAAAESERK